MTDRRREDILGRMPQDMAEVVRRIFAHPQPGAPLTAAEVRRGVRHLGRLMGEPEEVGAVWDDSADGVPVRVYRPKVPFAARSPGLVYVHGGGWVGGDVDAADGFARAVANRTGFVVLSVDYRLAPEHPYPAALDDCTRVLRWVEMRGSALSIDPHRTVLMGDSSGANLAAAAVARSHHAGHPVPSLLVMLYPALAPLADTRTHRAYGELSLGLRSEDMRWFWNTYAGGAQLDDWRLRPCEYPKLGGFPRTVVITAEFDPLCAEGEQFAERLTAAGVEVNAWRAPGMVHGYLWMAGHVSRARADLGLIGHIVRSAVYRPK